MAIDKCLFKRAPGACMLTEKGESKPTLAESKSQRGPPTTRAASKRARPARQPLTTTLGRRPQAPPVSNH